MSPSDENESASGGEIHLPRGILDLVVGAIWPKQPSELDQLRARLLHLELAKAAVGGSVAYVPISGQDLFGQERPGDWIWLGSRGSGKTAGAVAAAQARGKSWYAVDWPDEAADAVGGTAIPWARLAEVRDATIVVDETRLRLPRKTSVDDAMFELLALGRQRGLSIHWTSQSSASIPRDVLRMGPALCFKRSSTIADLYARQELELITSQARVLRESLGNGMGLVCVHMGERWYATELSLPEGWTETVSTLWR